MTKTQAKAIALDTIMDSVGVSYYGICDGNVEYTADEKVLILSELHKYCKRIAKQLKTNYVTY